MFCYKCGEENPDEAKFCKNCGAQLKKEEKKAIKTEVIEAPHQNNTHQKTTTSTSTSSSDSSNWIACCCIGLVVIFILSGLFSGI